MGTTKVQGLNGFQLKLMALILMTFDHIHQMFSYTGNIPIVFKWTGRIVAPIFMFLIIEGYIHTRSKGKYMIKLYIGSVVMNIGNYLMAEYFPRADGFLINNNIFSTFLMVTIYMVIVDYFKKSLSDKDLSKKILSFILFIIPLAVGSIILSIASVSSLAFLKYIIPNIYLVEGGPLMVVLGVILYLTKDNLYKQIHAYVIFSLSILVGSAMEGNFDIKQLFLENYQWMMIFSVPFFKLYNGERGRGLKYLFYVFYPLHIYSFYMISCSLMS